MRQSNETPSHFKAGSVSLRGPWLSNRGIELKPSPRDNCEGFTRHRMIVASLESERKDMLLMHLSMVCPTSLTLGRWGNDGGFVL